MYVCFSFLLFCLFVDIPSLSGINFPFGSSVLLDDLAIVLDCCLNFGGSLPVQLPSNTLLMTLVGSNCTVVVPQML